MSYLLLIFFSFIFYFFFKMLKLNENLKLIKNFLKSEKLFYNFKNYDDDEKQKALINYSLKLGKYSFLIMIKIILALFFIIIFFYTFNSIDLLFKLESLIILTILFLIIYFFEKKFKKNV